MIKVIVAGNRDFDNGGIFENAMTWLLPSDSDYAESIEIISGGCTGADALAEIYAKEWDIPLKVFPADWKKYGKYAGPIRNEEMAVYASSDEDDWGMLIAFWDGKSRGTKNMIDIAFKYGLDVHVIMWKRE